MTPPLFSPTSNTCQYNALSGAVSRSVADRNFNAQNRRNKGFSRYFCLMTEGS
jgi:hypothetical protein